MNLIFSLFILVFIQTTNAEDFFCKNIQLIMDKKKCMSFLSVQRNTLRSTKMRKTMNSMLEYLNTFEEAKVCNGTKSAEEDICSYIEVVKGNIYATDKLIASNEHALEMHNAK